MVIKALEFKKEDGTNIIIYVSLYNDFYGAIEWRIDDIQYNPVGKIKWLWLNKTFDESSEYRRLEIEEREQFKMNKYIEFVGKERVIEAFLSAWEKLKPSLPDVYINL